MYKQTDVFNPTKENKEDGVLKRVQIRKEQLRGKNEISLESFNKSMIDVQDAQKQILNVLMDGESEDNIKGDYHVIESQLTQKNKYILIGILKSIGMLYIYENENDEKKIMEGIGILSLDNKNTDNYTLKIIIKRRSGILPFYIDRIEISK